MPKVGDSVLLVVDDQGIYTSTLLRLDGNHLFCQRIPAYCAPHQNLRMLFPAAQRLWTLPVQAAPRQPVPDLLLMTIQGPASDRDPRQQPRYPIAITVSAQAPDGKALRTESTNLSLSGIEILWDQSLPVGSRLPVTLTHHHTSVVVQAQVVRTTPAPENSTVHIALMFINLATPDRDVLKAWIDEVRTRS
jgi:hypothetical protein